MKVIAFIIVLALFFSLSSCSDDDPGNSASQTYKYTGYDSTWNKIITGYLWIDSIDSLVVKGRWDFDLVGNGENIGPQIGNGFFEGSMNPLGTMVINLNPGAENNNVILDGSLRLPNRYDGLWSYVGIQGELNWGRFEAQEIK